MNPLDMNKKHFLKKMISRSLGVGRKVAEGHGVDLVEVVHGGIFDQNVLKIFWMT